MNLTLRSPVAADVEPCGRIIYEAFRDFATRHAFPPDFASPEEAMQLAGGFITHPQVFGVVAESDGEIVGSNFLDERCSTRGVGLITIAPRHQQRGVGRKLMQAVLDRGQGSAGIRLVQDAFNMTSFSLYASLGFEVREPLVLMSGAPRSKPPSGVEVRPLQADDVNECADLCRRVHGIDRAAELHDAPAFQLAAFVARRGSRLVAYGSALTFWPLNHGVAETEEDMTSLLSGAAGQLGAPLSLLVPSRQASFFRWCLSTGLRSIKPMALMTIGDYQQPKGTYYPSVEY